MKSGTAKRRQQRPAEQDAQDSHFMQQALAAARKGLGRTRPNPAVGAVIARKGRLLGVGFHRVAGLPHAEIEALTAVRGSVRGATLYVTLEPCNHRGRTGPCTEAIIEAGIAEVVIGCRDPNPVVRGCGAESLRRAGVRIRMGVLESACQELIEGYLKHVQTGLPLVILKAATSLDGRLATARGESAGLTGAEAHAHLHRLRDQCDAILVGSNTVLTDNPRLTVRSVRERAEDEPRLVRVVVDTRARTPSGANVVLGPGEAIIATTREAPTARIRRLERAGARVLVCRPKQGHVSLADLFRKLGKLGLMTVLVEGGGRIHGSLVREHLADRAMIYVAPRLIGGDGVPLLAGRGVAQLAATRLQDVEWLPLGEDALLSGRF